MSALCFGIYAYLSDKIASLRKQNMLLVNQNTELRAKIKKLSDSHKSTGQSIINVVDADYSDVN